MARITYHAVLGLQDIMKIGDLVLLPLEGQLFEQIRSKRISEGDHPSENLHYYDLLEVQKLSAKYGRERYTTGVEPKWAKKHPVALLVKMRRDFAITELDPLAIVNELPYTGLSYMVEEDGLCGDVYRTFNLGRLSGIKQLGFLQAPLSLVNDMQYRMPLSESNRYIHSLDVMAVATMIGQNLGLSASRMATLRTAALTHDIATPAGGDSVKMVDFQALDEDLNYKPYLERMDGWKELAQKWNIRKDVLFSTIRNEGLLGEILDVADKCAYVGRDIKSFRNMIEGWVSVERHGMETLQRLLYAAPQVCSIWDSLAVCDGRLVFTDIPRLVTFLKVRVLLFREFYYHPRARFGEFMMSRLLVKALYKKGILTPEILLELDDNGLELIIQQEYGYRVFGTIRSDQARVETFYSMPEAERFMSKLKRQGNLFVLCDDNTRAIKTGTNFLVRTKGMVMKLADAAPLDAQEIQQMAELLPRVHVYWIEGEPAVGRELLDELIELLELR